jgi:hypothetical protein
MLGQLLEHNSLEPPFESASWGVPNNTDHEETRLSVTDSLGLDAGTTR